MTDQKLQSDLDAASLRIAELKLDFRAMRSEAMRLKVENLQLIEELQQLHDANALLRKQIEGWFAGDLRESP